MRLNFIIFYILFSIISLSAHEHYKNNSDSLRVQMPQKKINDQWFGRDKVHHFTVSAFLTGFGYYAAKNELNLSNIPARNFSIGFSFSFGLLKEIYDGSIKNSTASYKDIVADIAGTGAGLLILNIKF